MKKLVALVMGLMMMLMMVAGCGNDGPKKMVIGLDDNFAPMGYRNEKNEIVGMDIDLAREACKRAGMEVEFKPIDWGAKEAELKSKRIDAIWNCFTVNPEREKVYGMSTVQNVRPRPHSPIPHGSVHRLLPDNQAY